jgi:Transposase, Mutator family
MEETSARTEAQPFRGEDWFDPLATAVRGRIRGFIEEMLEAELEGALQRRRYDRRGTTRGHRHGHRERHLVGTFGPVTLSVPRARLAGADGKTSEWRNRTIPAYQRLTKRAEGLIAAAYLSGTNTRRERGRLARFPGRSGHPWPRQAGTRHRRWCTGPGGSARGAVAADANPTLHGP